MKHDFNHKAETFDSPKNIFLANLVCQAIEKQLDLLLDKEILDFGGGTGLLALPLAKQSKSVTLVDISEKMLEQARLKAEQQKIKNIQFLEQDLLENPLKQEFDLIAVCSVVFAFESSVLSSDFCSVFVSMTLFCSSTIPAVFCAVLISSLIFATAFAAVDC